MFSFACSFSLLFFVLLFADILTAHVTTLAGSSNGFQDGIGSNSKFHGPSGICFNHLDNCLFVSDYFNNKIRKVTMNGI
jgi:hypothetical protein